jgi:hypothetical protein
VHMLELKTCFRAVGHFVFYIIFARSVFD